MDIGTGIALLGPATIVAKILGPTADYIGKGIENWTKKRVDNVKRIFSKAEDKLGDKIDESGEVPPKVLKLVLDEGSFCDDELTQEYFAGVLASSRSSTPRDDRGAYFLNLVGKLSNYQIRTHYIFYTVFRNLYDTPFGNLSRGDVRRSMRMHMPMEVYRRAMNFSRQEDSFEIATHALNGLMRELLIDKGWTLGSSDNFSELGGTPDLPHGIIYATSISGLELYLWAMGKANISINSFLHCEECWHFEKELIIEHGSTRLTQNDQR